MQVKLVFEKSYQELKGLTNNTFAKTVNIDLPDHIDQAHLVSAISYATKNGSDSPSMDEIANIWDYTDENHLVGKLLTYIDATYTDKEQRDAHKSLIKDLVYGYCQELKTRAREVAQNVNEK